MKLQYGMTDDEAQSIIQMVADGAVEFTVAESPYIYITYYFTPETGQIRAVLAGGC